MKTAKQRFCVIRFCDRAINSLKFERILFASKSFDYSKISVQFNVGSKKFVFVLSFKLCINT